MAPSVAGCFRISIQPVTFTMEVKIQCACGTRYKFEVEPIDGQMPGPVSCPTCGADGTGAGNAIIHQSLSSQSAAALHPTPAKPRIRLSAPAPSEPAPTVPPPTFHAATPAPALAPLSAARPARAQPYPPGEASLLLGIVGAVVAGLVGVLAWYLICKGTGLKLRILAIGVGWLTGYGARLFYKPGGHRAGISAGIVALLTIVIGQLAI